MHDAGRQTLILTRQRREPARPRIGRAVMPTPTPLLRRLFHALLVCLSLGVVTAHAQHLNERAREQIAALLTEKARRTPAQARLDSQLVYLLKRRAGAAELAAAPELQPGVRTEADGRLLVDIRGRITPELARFITSGGGEILASVPRFDSLRARLAPAQLEALAARPEVRFIEPAVEAETNLGPVLSGGDAAHLADLARADFGVDGTGLKIGVLSDGADSLTVSKTAGELNARARALGGQAGAGDEGTAMMEIVQDLLPGAELIFATAFNGDASFANNILSLQAAGCSIIVDDVTYFNESPFQDMVIAQAVNSVSDAGVLFFSSAGNSGNKNDGTSGVWEGDFLAGGAAGSPLTTTGTLHDFGGGLTYNTVADGGSSRRVDLFWADPNGASANDYDLFILNSTGTSVLRSSTNLQTGSQNPYESVGTLNIGERIVIVQKPGAANRYLHLSTGRAVLSVSTAGQTRGHNASGAANAFCVAAVRTSAPASPAAAFTTGNKVETFSSDGPRRMFYQPDGTPFTPGNFSASGGLLLAKPDLTAANGVATSVPGFTTFFGTSASAPHAAAIAGLLQAYNPELSAAEIRALLNASALDIEATGTDRDSGVGIVMAEAALSAAAAPDALRVAGAGLVATGPKGGPFTPSGGSHTLTNSGASPIDWTATPNAAWFSVSPAAGSLAPGASTVVTVTLEAAAAELAGGQHQAGLVFRNSESGFERALSVHLNAAFDPFPNPIDGSGTGPVPDGVASTPPAPGEALTVSIPVSGLTENVSRVAVRLSLSHAWAGDLEAVLTSPGGSRSLVLFSRIGATTATSFGSGSAFNGTYLFTDSATGPNLWTAAANSATVPPGLYRTTAAGGAGQTQPAPVTSLDATFGGLTPAEANGTWTLSFRDYCAPDQGTVSAAALSFSPIESLSANHRLANLTTDAGSLDPDFDPDTQRYALTVPAGTASLRLTATAEDPGALIDLGLHGDALLPVSSGSPSPALPLADGLNLLDLQVTAPSGLARTYRLAVTRLGEASNLTVPIRQASDRGLNVPLRSDAWTMQFIYAKELLRYLPPGTKIQGLAFRLWIGQSIWPPSPRNWSAYSVELSAATRSPGALSATFADNVGADAVTGRSGALAVATGAYPGGNNPNAFGPLLSFDTPYVYQGGDLLITLRHNGSGGGDFPFIETLPSQDGWFECLAAEGQSATAAVYTADTPVIQLSFELPQPEITLAGNGVAITSGDSTPSTEDHTDFGPVRLDGEPVARSFTLSNSGAATLQLGGLDLDGDADFSLLAPLPASLAPGTSTSFSLVFTPTALGDRTAVVSIASDDADENPFTFTIQGRGIAPEIALSGNTVAIASGDTTPSADDHTDFGSTRLDGDPVTRSFTLSNTGEATLHLGGLDLDGDADFSLLAPLPASLAPGTSTNFSLVFTPAALGDRTAVVAIASDDADEHPFTFTIQGRGIAPEIALSGNTVAIASGDTTPSADDHTDFGSTRLDGDPVARSFTLSNTGEATLHLGGFDLDGDADFSLLAPLPASLAPGTSTSFSLVFTPAALGDRTAVVALASDDADENPFTFTIQGRGIAPEITLSGNAVAIASGDTTPSVDDHTDFGAVRLDGDSVARSFTLSNTGEATLHLGGLDLDGDADFSLLAPLPASLAPGTSTTFSLVFTPAALGDRTAVVAITSDDADENPFTFTVQGRGIAPEIALSGNAVAIASGDTTPSVDDHTDFGAVRLDSDPVTRSFTLSNTGEAILHLGGLDLDGDADFSLLAPLPASLAPGTSTSFSLVFTPTALGDRTAVVAITSDDADENPFTFTVQGRGIAPEISLSGNAVAIASGDSTPSLDDHTDFGTIQLAGETFSHSFTLSNTGEATLHLSGTPKVEVTGPQAKDFEVLTEPSSPLEPGASTTFTLACRPRLPGERRAELRIASDDPTTPEFRFTIRAFGLLPQALAQTLSFDPPKVIYLSQSPLTLSAEASSGRPVLLEVVAGPGVLTDGLLQVQEPGVVKVRASQAGGGNDAPAVPVLRSITVKPDPSQLTLIDLVQVYDGTPRVARVLGADGPVTLTYKIAGVEGSDAPVNAGKYAVRARAGTRTKTGTLTVLKAPLWVTPEDARRFAGEANPIFNVNYRGFVEGEDETVLQSQPVLTTKAKATSPGGFYAITSRGGAAANYVLRQGAGTLFVEAFGSTWAALLRDADRPAGRVEIVLNAANTRFSAKLQHAAAASPLALVGPLILNAEAEQTAGSARLEKNGLVCQLNFTLDLEGHLHADATCNGLPLLANDGRRLRTKAAGRVEHAGTYTVLLEPALPAADGVPGGAGWARAALADSGLMNLVGSLGDGTRFTASLPADEAGDPGYLLFLQPYQPARAGAYLGGAFRLLPHPSLPGRRHVPEAVLAWDKTGLAKDAAYPEGFTGREVVLLLDPWLKPARGETLAPRLGLTADSLHIEHDTVAITDDLPTLLQLGSRSLIVLDPAANPAGWKSSLKTDSGLLSGSFVRLVDGKKQTVRWTGLLRQPPLPGDVLIGAGHFLLPSAGAGQTTGDMRFLVQEE
jgi:hypothetical protein